jgi:ParB-like chromosome segregation protein Spo0J
MKMNEQPINNVQWIDNTLLTANDYNPNVVLNQELKLLEYSLLKNGWIQPILINKNEDGAYTVIDGFHRWSLSRSSKKVAAMTEGKVPCVVMELEEHERMLLTIRINRAKGSHVAFRMSEIIKSLVEDGISPEYIAQSIGATKQEIDLLMMDDVFKKLDIQNHKYSKAWYPKYD